jgi:serine/threonine-protein kinase
MSAPDVTPGQPPCPKCGYLADTSNGLVNFCPKCGNDLRALAEDEERTLTHPWVGSVIADRYRLLSLLGEGGMGAVYKAEHIRMGKALALKLLRGPFAREEGAVARFRSEAFIVSRLSHPHTIAVFDFGEIANQGGFYLAMEYVPGKDLSTVLREQGKISESRAAAIGEQVLGSLAEAHDSGIVHRDVKPGNIMLMQTRSGEDFAKVLDFGIAKLRDESPNSCDDSSAGAIIGTPNYLSPEQARGQELDARADLYSLGVVLYELVSGRCPFVAPNPMAVVQSHLLDEPPPLSEVAPGVSPAFAELVHRALKKRPQERFQSADDMRDALLALGAVPGPGMPATSRPSGPEVTGALPIANRQDFEEFERQLRALKRSRVIGPVAVLALALVAALTTWRWSDIYQTLRRRAPGIAAALPAAVRPSDLFDGEEHEPNNSPAQANVLPIPPGPDGQPAGGVAIMRGHIGPKISDTVGDVDVFRIEVPAGQRPLAMHAEWSSERPGEGIRGLHVALTLNRDRGPESGRMSAPLVASVDRGGPGRTEELVAAVGAGVYYLAVRERHSEATGPVEKPTDWYLLKVWLAEIQPGEEVEPNDGPDSVEHREIRYREWREVADRNPLGEANPIRGSTSPEDPDTFSIAARGPTEAPELVVIVPEPRLSVTARLWIPDAMDLTPSRPSDRVRFDKAGLGGFGELLFLPLPSIPASNAPDLLLLKAAEGSGTYTVLALGRGPASSAAVLALLGELEKQGRNGQALALAAGYAHRLPVAERRTDVLMAAAKLAERTAATLKPEGLVHFAEASKLLGAELFETSGTRVRYTGVFEAQVEGQGHQAEEAAARLISRGAPCSAADVAKRASAFLDRYPTSTFAPQARLWLARASEDLYFQEGKRPYLARALDLYRSLAKAKGEAAAEAKQRTKRLAGKKPARPSAPRINCALALRR